MMAADPDGGRTEAGPFGEEAARLLGAAQDWLHRAVLDPATAKVATGSPECCWCPLCQLIAATRGNRGQLTERLSDTLSAMTELQTTLAGLLRWVTEPAAAGEPAADRPARTVHRIDLSDDPAEPAESAMPGESVMPDEPTAAGEPTAADEPTAPDQPGRTG